MKSILLSNILFVYCTIGGVTSTPVIRDYPEMIFRMMRHNVLGIEIKNCQKYENLVMYGYVNRKCDPWSYSDFSKNFQVELKSGSCFAYASVDIKNSTEVNYLIYFDFMGKPVKSEKCYNINLMDNSVTKRRSRRKLRKSSRENKSQSNQL